MNNSILVATFGCDKMQMTLSLFAVILKSDLDFQQTSLKVLLVELRLELSCHFRCDKVHNNYCYNLFALC
jgi:hypothetical protein